MIKNRNWPAKIASILVMVVLAVMMTTSCSVLDLLDEGGSPERQISESGTYDSKDEVALYIHTYNKLPSNYITKKQARKLGWRGGSLEKYAKSKCIGGDRYGNYEGRLPKNGNQYHECDIDTLGKSKRGAKRIVYSTRGNIYYTDDHYNTFTELYDKNGEKQ